MADFPPRPNLKRPKPGAESQDDEQGSMMDTSASASQRKARIRRAVKRRRPSQPDPS